MKSIGMTALLLASGVFSACSSADDITTTEQTNNDAQQVYTMTVQATKGDDAFTRGLVLSEDGKTLSVKWNEGEKVYVLQNVGNDKWTEMGALTATPDAEDPTKATLTGSFGLNKVNPAATALRFVLHKAWMDYESQQGKLIDGGDQYSIENGYDYASCEISSKDFTIADNTISITNANGITLKSEQAIVKFILTEADGTTPVEAYSLIIDDENDGIVLFEDYTKPSDNGRTVKGNLQIDYISDYSNYYGIFVAINNPEETNYTLTAHALGGLTYSFKTKSQVKFEKGKYYVVKVKMNADNAVDLGLSVLWANMNVGASLASEYPEAQSGGYFAWGATDQQTTYDWANAPFYTGDGTNHSWSKYNTTHGTLALSSNYIDYSDCYDAARYKWHGSWRMPTNKEWLELTNNCHLTWVENYNSTGIAGVLATSRIEGYTDKSIFLPAAGYKDDRTETENPGLRFENQYVQYWSSTFDSPRQPELAEGEKILKTNSSAIPYPEPFERCLGMPIRPVMEQVQVSATTQGARTNYGDAVEFTLE